MRIGLLPAPRARYFLAFTRVSGPCVAPSMGHVVAGPEKSARRTGGVMHVS